MKEHKLESGVTLKIRVAPFEKSKALFDAVSKEVKGVRLDPMAEVTDVNFIKDTILGLLSNKEIENALWACLEHCQYGPHGLKIDKDTFEDEAAREDYLEVCHEVTVANILPFVKRLYAKWSPIFQKILGLSQK